MNRDQQNIDKLFHENLAGASDQPPMRIWDNIENALDQSEKEKFVFQKNNKRRYAGLAALMLMMAALGVVWVGDGERRVTIKKIEAGRTGKNTGMEKSSEDESPVAVKRMKDADAVRNNAMIGQHENYATGSKFVKKEDMPATGSAMQDSDATVQNKIGETQVENVTASHELATDNDPLNKIKEGTIDTRNLMEKPIVKDALTLMEPAQPVHRMSPAVQTIDAAPAPAGKGLVKLKKQSRFAIIAFFAPDITTRNLEQNISVIGATKDENKEEISRTEKNGMFDFTFGARVEYKLGKRFSLQSGLSFSTNTIDIATKTVFARVDKRDGALKYRFNLSSGYAYFKLKNTPPPQFLGDSTQFLSSSSTLHYVNIPLAVKYNIPYKRFNFSILAGMTVRFIANQSIEAVYAANGNKERSRANQIQGLKTSYFNGVLGAGVDYALNSKFAVSLFPSFNFATTSINRDSPVKAYPNTLSIATGLKLFL